jgi:hypothetical protein
MTPRNAISALLANNWTEQMVAAEAGTTQPTINRIKHGASPSYEVGARLVELAAANGVFEPKRTRKEKAA